MVPKRLSAMIMIGSAALAALTSTGSATAQHGLQPTVTSSAPVCKPVQTGARYVPPPAGGQINPAATNPAITPPSTECFDHFVYPHRTATSRGLLVYLGGKNSPSSSSTLLASSYAKQGFDVIDLAYGRPTNGEGVSQVCRSLTPSSAIDACYSALLGEIAYGANVSFGAIPPGGYDSPYASIDAANSILGRTVYLLRYLGWTQYLVSGPTAPYGGQMVDTAHTVIAGGSAGASYSAFTAHQFAFARVDTYSGPEDDDAPLGSSGACPTPAPPSWTSTTVTPSAGYVGFIEGNDPHLSCIEADWSALGYTGPITTVTTTFPSGVQSHQLQTFAKGSCSQSPPDSYHTCPYDDFTTPLSGTSPVFKPVWSYLGNGG